MLTLRRRSLTVAVLAAPLVVASMAVAQPPDGETQAEPEPTPPVDLPQQNDEQRLRELVRDELALSGSDESESDAERLADLFDLALNIQFFLLTAFTLVGGLVAWLGWREFRSLRSRAQQEVDKVKEQAGLAEEAARKADADATTIEAKLGGIETVTRYYSSLIESSKDIQRSVAAEFSKIDPGVFVEVVGVEGAGPPQFAFWDIDQLHYALFHLKLLPDRELAARTFCKLARLWRRHHQFDRALERFRLAAEIAPESLVPVVDGQRAITLTNLAGWKLFGSQTTSKADPGDLLKEAEGLLDGIAGAESIEQVDLLFARGVNLHLQERFGEAVAAFRQALALPPKPLIDEESLVDTSPDILRYNLAAGLCRNEQFQECLDELRQLPEEARRDAFEDRDFEKVREHPELGAEFRKLTGHDG